MHAILVVRNAGNLKIKAKMSDFEAHLLSGKYSQPWAISKWGYVNLAPSLFIVNAMYILCMLMKQNF